MTLSAIQTDFLSAVCAGDDDGDSGSAMRCRLREDNGVSLERRLDVYRQNITETRYKALAAIYPVCIAVLGERYWRRLVRTPQRLGSAQSDLNVCGDEVPGMMATAVRIRPELEDLPYLPDLARLERTAHQVRLAADSPAFDLTAFAALSERERSSVPLEIATAFTLFRSPWPVDVIWNRHAGEPSSGPEPEGPADCCVWRDSDLNIRVARLGEKQIRLLSSVSAGANLTQLGAMQGPGEEAILARWLHEWIRSGWIAGFGVPEDGV